MDLETGKIVWSHQVTARDAYVSACRLTDKTNCPEVNGPDFDFAASPILVSLSNGKRALVAGHKSGNVYAVDPDQQGARLWETRVGEGGSMGGVQWGSAADQQNVYVALSDLGRVMLTYTQFTDADRNRGGGMFALRLSDGARVWHTPPTPCDSRPRCSPAQSGAVSAMPGRGVLGIARRPHPRVRERHGQVVWDFDTVREYETVNGVPARGGSLDGPGAGDRRRHDVRQLGIHRGRRHAGQRRSRVFSRREVIRSSHVGTLPRPDQLEALCTRNELPRDSDAFTAIVPGIIADVVGMQAALGLTIVNDGEFGKRGGFSYYARTRLAGIESRSPELTPAGRDITARDAIDFPGYYRARRSGA